MALCYNGPDAFLRSVQPGKRIANTFTFVACILYDVYKLGVVLRRHRWPLHGKFTNSSRVSLRGDMIFGNQSLLLGGRWIDAHSLNRIPHPR
jgi:hypothetical protein